MQRNRVHFERETIPPSRSSSVSYGSRVSVGYSSESTRFETRERDKSTGDYYSSPYNEYIEHARNMSRPRTEPPRSRHQSENRSTRQRTDRQRKGLSKTFSLLKSSVISDTDTPLYGRNMPLDRTWSTFAKNWTDGVATFRIIQSSEYTADKSNAQTIRLVCSNGAGAHSLPSEPKGTKWMLVDASNARVSLN